MRFMSIYTCLCFIASVNVTAQEMEIKARYYFSTGDYLEEKLSNDEVILEIRQKGEDYLYVKDILDPSTRKKADDESKAWAISYDGHAYVNLKYSNNAYAKNLFVQMDLKGRFCLAVMDPEFAPILDKADSDGRMAIGGMTHTYDGSIGGNFLDQEGIEKLIFIIDTKDLSIVLPYKANNAPINLLSVSTLKWLVGKDKYKGSKKEYIVEEIVEIVEDLNRRQQ